MKFSKQQILQASNAGVAFLNLPSTLVPGNMRKQVAVLELILCGLRAGNLQLVSALKTPVESEPETPEDANNGGPGKTPA